MKKFLNAFEYKFEEMDHEVNTEPSCTVPDMTMSLGEILTRYTRGGEVATFQPVYQENDDFDNNPDISKMDTMERLQYANEIRQSLADYQNRVKDRDKGNPPKKENEPPKTEKVNETNVENSSQRDEPPKP